MRPADHVAAADINVVLEAHGDGHRRKRLLHRAVAGVDRLDGRRHAAGQNNDIVARLEHTAGNLAGVTAVVVQLMACLRLRPDDVLHREARVDEIAVARDVHLFEVMEQRGAVVPRRAGAARHDVVTEQRRDRDERQVADVKLGRELTEFVANPLENGLVVVDEVHLVDAQHEVRNAEQRRDERVPSSLLDDALARIDKDQREVGR